MLVLIDGQFVREEDAGLPVVFLDRLILKVVMRAERNNLMFFEEHLAGICRQLELLGHEIPAIFEKGGKEFKRQTERALTRNKLFKSAIVTFYLFRNSPTVSYLILTSVLDGNGYELNREGLTIELETGIFKADCESSLSPFRAGSEPYWKTLQEEPPGFSVRILLNRKGSLVEAPGRNLYLVCGNQVHCPAPSTGAYRNVAGKLILEAVANTGLTCKEECFLDPEELLKADEVFLGGDLHGIQWVKAFREKRYFNKKIRLIAGYFSGAMKK